jgi:hypothetical protein
MRILVDGLTSSISVLTKHAQFKKRRLSAVVHHCPISENLPMSAVAWVDTPERFPTEVTQ